MEHDQQPTSPLEQSIRHALGAFPLAAAQVEHRPHTGLPHGNARQGAFARMMLAALAPHLKHPDIAATAARIGAWCEQGDDLDLVARIGSRLWREGEESLVELMLDALAPDGRPAGLHRLESAIGSERAALAVVRVWNALPEGQERRAYEISL